jgi:hypothetical protein
VNYSYSPPREEGWPQSGRGGRAQLNWLVSDHPVCGTKVGFAENFLDAAASPPREEGNASRPNSASIFSQFATTAEVHHRLVD